MFRRLPEPLPLSEASVLAMRPALNAPVLNVGFLPVGPARAAILAFGEEWGGIGIALGIRSNEGGQVAVFRNEESIEPDVSITEALEPALAEAERMGFLLDEDMVEATASGRNRALALWGQLMGEFELPQQPPHAVPPPPATSESIRPLPDRSIAAPAAPAEFILDDVAEIELPEISLDLEASVTALPTAAPPTPPPGEVVPPRAMLVKFRNSDSAVAENDEDTSDSKGNNQLGRIPLVRVRKERDGSKRIPYLARLLSSF